MTSEFQTAGIFKGALAGGIAAGVVNVGLYFAGSAAGATYLMLPPGATEKEAIPIAMPFVMSVVPALLGAAVLVGLLRFLPAMAWKIFLGVTAVAFIAMLPGPAMQVAGDMPAIVVLEVMHVVVVVAVLGGIHKLGRA